MSLSAKDFKVCHCWFSFVINCQVSGGGSELSCRKMGGKADLIKTVFWNLSASCLNWFSSASILKVEGKKKKRKSSIQGNIKGYGVIFTAGIKTKNTQRPNCMSDANNAPNNRAPQRWTLIPWFRPEMLATQKPHACKILLGKPLRGDSVVEKACQERFGTQRMTEVGLVVRAFLSGKGRLGKKIQQNEAEGKKMLEKGSCYFYAQGKIKLLIRCGSFWIH